MSQLTQENIKIAIKTLQHIIEIEKQFDQQRCQNETDELIEEHENFDDMIDLHYWCEEACTARDW